MIRNANDAAGSGVPALELRDLSALSPNRRDGRLRGASLRAFRGSCLALLGERADAGRFLLELVTGYERPSSGAVLVDGVSVSALPPGRRGVAMVSERDPLFPFLSLRDNVLLPLRARRLRPAERERRADEMLAILGLDAVARRRADAVEPADAVRARLARALVFDPAVVLLDDPLGRLDAPVRDALRRTLRRLIAARRLCVVLSTVDRDEALLMGDAVGVLHEGALPQLGPAEQLLDRAASPAVARVLGDANLLPGQVLRSEDEVVSVRLACGAVMDAEAAAPLPAGAFCVLSVRPDRIATAFLSRPPAGPGEDGDLPAVLLDAVHMGDHARLRFRLSDGAELLVRRPPAARTGEMRPGRAAMLAWQPHQARAFAAAD